MRNGLALAALATACAVSVSWAAENPAASAKGITIFRGAGVETDLVSKVAGALASALRVPVHVEAAPAFTNTSTAKDVVAISQGRGKSEPAVLVLVDERTKKKGQGVIVAGNTAALNIAALRISGGDSAADGKFVRRVEKESSAAIGRALGLKRCPNPNCALFDHASLKELDMKGRNLCPPCQQAAQKALKARGATLDTPKPNLEQLKQSKQKTGVGKTTSGETAPPAGK